MPVLRGFLLGAFSFIVVGCGPPTADSSDGDPRRGRDLLRQYGCNACHRIPGVSDAVGTVGPPLDDIGERIYLAGTLPNSSQNMARWIRAPEAFKAGTAMPDLIDVSVAGFSAWCKAARAVEWRPEDESNVRPAP